MLQKCTWSKSEGKFTFWVFRSTIYAPMLKFMPWLDNLVWSNTSKDINYLLPFWPSPDCRQTDKATVGWSLEWRIFGEPFWWSRSAGKEKIKKILANYFFFSYGKCSVGRSFFICIGRSAMLKINWPWPNRQKVMHITLSLKFNLLFTQRLCSITNDDGGGGGGVCAWNNQFHIKYLVSNNRRGPTWIICQLWRWKRSPCWWHWRSTLWSTPEGTRPPSEATTSPPICSSQWTGNCSDQPLSFNIFNRRLTWRTGFSIPAGWM